MTVTGSIRTADHVEWVFYNPLMKQIHQKVLEIAKTDVPVLIHGEKGVGKATVARVIHQRSRPGKPFIRVNCKNIPAELQAVELLGCQKGESKESQLDRPGMLQFANGGTLYLEELQGIIFPVQATLIQLLKESKFVGPGSDQEMDVNIRLIASTRHGVQSTGLHPDWYAHLSAVDIEIPPLRERKNEIPLLCDYFLKRLCMLYDETVKPISKELMKRFETYDWDVENVKELENAVKRYFLDQVRR